MLVKLWRPKHFFIELFPFVGVDAGVIFVFAVSPRSGKILEYEILGLDSSVRLVFFDRYVRPFVYISPSGLEEFNKFF